MAFPHYIRVCDWLRKNGVRNIFLDSDGRIWDLIPIWIDAGVTGIFPCEVQAGMDVVAMRKKYGRDLALVGGIDKKAVARGGSDMRNEVDRILPVVEDGGYIPHLDHTAPPDISWNNMCRFMEYLMKRVGR